MSMPLLAQLHLTLPVWTHELELEGRDFAGDEAKVAFAIELSRRNVEARSGGPFGAAVFDGNDRVVAVVSGCFRDGDLPLLHQCVEGLTHGRPGCTAEPGEF